MLDNQRAVFAAINNPHFLDFTTEEYITLKSSILAKRVVYHSNASIFIKLQIAGREHMFNEK